MPDIQPSAHRYPWHDGEPFGDDEYAQMLERWSCGYDAAWDAASAVLGKPLDLASPNARRAYNATIVALSPVRAYLLAIDGVPCGEYGNWADGDALHWIGWKLQFNEFSARPEHGMRQRQHAAREPTSELKAASEHFSTDIAASFSTDLGLHGPVEASRRFAAYLRTLRTNYPKEAAATAGKIMAFAARQWHDPKITESIGLELGWDRANAVRFADKLHSTKGRR